MGAAQPVASEKKKEFLKYDADISLSKCKKQVEVFPVWNKELVKHYSPAFSQILNNVGFLRRSTRPQSNQWFSRKGQF